MQYKKYHNTNYDLFLQFFIRHKYSMDTLENHVIHNTAILTSHEQKHC